MSNAVADMSAALAGLDSPSSEEEPKAPLPAEPNVARILLADDDRQIRRTLGRVLRKHGFEVVEAVDGVEAMEQAELRPPDLALVDLRMPRKDGFDVVRELKASNPRLPVLVLSGWDDADDRVQAFDVGADDFISKPVYMKELLRRIDAFERTRRAYLELQALNEHADHLRLFAAEAAALLAHDLNNGLSIASANLQFIDEELRDRAEDEDDDLVDAAAAGRRALRRMIGLVANFVDISRLEDAALQVVRFPTRIHDLLRTTGQIHETSRSDIQGITIECPEDLVADIDPMLVERVLHNLLNNATRYVDAGGRIHLVARQDGDELYLAVANTGAVIPVEKRAGLFAKYGKGGDGKSQRGMGLYFCRLACEAHNGSISVEDAENFATVFAIRLNLHAGADDVASSQEQR